MIYFAHKGTTTQSFRALCVVLCVVVSWCSVQPAKAIDYYVNTNPIPSQKMDFSFFKQKTNPDVKPYKFMDDLTFVGIPLFVAGWIAKGEKHGFRQKQKHSLVTNFRTHLDDYLQYVGPVTTIGMKLGGYEGRSDWPRLIAGTALSYGIMAGLVNTIKYSTREMRPDGTSANSWPSGHTATAFVGATILHKEYGLTHSPWFSVLGYGTATATGVMRVLNNRHWISDVLSGAGIGIISGELAYALCDLLFKGKGLLRGNINSDRNIIENPNFFSVSMGMGFGTRNIEFDMDAIQGLECEDDDKDVMNLKFGTSTSVSAEGAYFFNKYVGVGSRLRLNSMPIKGWGRIIDYGWQNETLDDAEFIIQSDHLTEFSADFGAYFNLPISERFALGSKLLLGRSVMQEVNLEASQSDVTWDYFTVGGNKTIKYGTGASLTYAYKNNYAWKLYLDYDYARKTYTMTYNPDGGDSNTQHAKKNMNNFVLGGSFVVNF